MRVEQNTDQAKQDAFVASCYYHEKPATRSDKFWIGVLITVFVLVLISIPFWVPALFAGVSPIVVVVCYLLIRDRK
jgi:hypothetical protein